ncbi:MAG: hypothetical protein JW862_19985 [Anaerolineales bacterium]|nr:hypothetical protein [Anaerolineales bacterium]
MEILEFATQLARLAGECLVSHYQLDGIQANLKADRTVVTEADLAADRILRQAIEANFPEDGLISEEANTICPADKQAVWVIDPLDGSTNFSLGLHYWGVSIARLVNGRPDIAALYFPLLNELFSAQRGQGAWLNGGRLHVQEWDPDQPASFFACCSRTLRRYRVGLRFKARILGSAAYDLCAVARGSAVLAFQSTPKIWDFAGSWLVTEEAGGLIGPLHGPQPFPLQPGRDYAQASFPLLVAPDQHLWQMGSQEIVPK